MRKRVILFASSLGLALTGCFAPSAQHQGPFGPLLNLLDKILIKLPANFQNEAALAKFLIWMLIFAILHLPSSKLFKDNRRVAIAVNLIISFMGVLLIPNALIQQIYQLYSNVFLWLLVLGPAALGGWIIHTYLKEHNTVNRILRPLVAWGLVYMYTTFTANAAVGLYAGQVGPDYLGVSNVLGWGVSLMSFVAIIYTIQALGAFGGWKPKSGGAAPAIQEGGLSASHVQEHQDLHEDVKEQVRKLVAQETQEVSQANAALTELESLEKEELASLQSIAQALHGMESAAQKYASQLSDPQVQRYLRAQLQRVQQAKATFDQERAKIDEHVNRLEPLIQSLDQGLAALSTAAGREEDPSKRAKIATQIDKAEELLGKMHTLDEQLKTYGAKEREEESNFIQQLNKALQHISEPSLFQNSLASARGIVEELQRTLQSFEKFTQELTQLLSELPKIEAGIQEEEK